MAQIRFENVTYSYDGHTPALDGLTLSIEAGSFTCILGGNGSGKTTLAKCINGLLVPDSGTVITAGNDTGDPALIYKVRSDAGMVFQNPDDQIVASIVEDDVAFGPENLGVPSEEIRRRVDEALSTVGLAGFSQRETHGLSGGQKQRLSLADALAMEPHILILDEASAMLDPQGRQELMELCHRLNSEGLTLVYITHFMEQAAQASRVVVLEKGAVSLDGPPASVLTQASKLKELSLELPFPVAMSQALRAQNVPVELCLEESALEQALIDLGLDLRVYEDDQGPAQQPEMLPESTPAEEPLLRFESVWFSYDPPAAKAKKRLSNTTEDAEPLWALADVSFELLPGDFLGIAGHTGSGKSTLVQLANGLLQPTEGEVFLKGRNLGDKRSLAEARSDVGLVFQYPERQLFAATVFDDVAFGPRNLGFSAEEVQAAVERALEAVHLSSEALKDKSPFALSGGQQRRVALAGVLAMNPSTLILDEPTAGLDPKGHDSLMTLIQELHDQHHITVVMVSHNMDDLGYLTNRLLILNEGRIFAEGAPLSVFSHEQALRSIGLDLPRTLHLVRILGLEGQFSSTPTIDELARVIADTLSGA